MTTKTKTKTKTKTQAPPPAGIGSELRRIEREIEQIIREIDRLEAENGGPIELPPPVIH
jgi:hypothetical protein